MDILIFIGEIVIAILFIMYIQDKKKKKQIERDCNPHLFRSDEVNDRINGINPKER